MLKLEGNGNASERLISAMERCLLWPSDAVQCVGSFLSPLNGKVKRRFMLRLEEAQAALKLPNSNY